MQKPKKQSELSEDEGSLVRATRLLLHKDRRTRYTLAKELEIPLAWLNAFAQNRHRTYDVNRIQKLFEILKGKKLPL